MKTQFLETAVEMQKRIEEVIVDVQREHMQARRGHEAHYSRGANSVHSCTAQVQPSSRELNALREGRKGPSTLQASPASQRVLRSIGEM